MAGPGASAGFRAAGVVLALVVVATAVVARVSAAGPPCSPTTVLVMDPPTVEAGVGIASALDGFGGAGTLRDLARAGDPTASRGLVLSISWVWEVRRSNRADHAGNSPVVVGWAHRQSSGGNLEVLLLREAALPATGRGSWEALILHELGHLAGLAHSDRVGNVMYPRLDGMGTLFDANQSIAVRAFDAAHTCG